MTHPLFPAPNPVPSYWLRDPSPLADLRSTPHLPTACDIAVVGAGLAGVLLILRPGGDGWGWPALRVLASVGFVTGRDMVARFVSRAVPSMLIAAVTAVVVRGQWRQWWYFP